MKPLPSSDRARSAAFTLTEMLVAMTILTMVVGSVIYCHVMGMQLNQITISKLGVDQQARNAFNRLHDEVRSATTIEIGNGTATTFTTISNGLAQAGMALRICPTTNTANWIRYYYEPSARELRRVDYAVATPRTIAQNLTNAILFQAENYAGTVLTGPANNRVLNVTLRFNPTRFSSASVGTNALFDYYTLQAKITRRIL